MPRFTKLEREALIGACTEIQAGDAEAYYNGGCEIDDPPKGKGQKHAVRLAKALSSAFGKIGAAEALRRRELQQGGSMQYDCDHSFEGPPNAPPGQACGKRDSAGKRCCDHPASCHPPAIRSNEELLDDLEAAAKKMVLHHEYDYYTADELAAYTLARSSVLERMQEPAPVDTFGL